MRAAGPLIASPRMLVLAGLIALLLGGCVSTLDHPVERTFAEQITQSESVPARAGPVEPPDQAEWRLRLSYL
ncbi:MULTISPECIES: hypothetical protein [Methylobacterium]|uniref:RND transporter n=1 Tax=Methylobacterium longum TaxID=767694 RepID=A0ABT8ASI5_9HYPH|nr:MULTISPECIES: hypothetical protein [Methylobacterium]MCJ2098776.1 hypothetical protein [Methylobacterium sp. E-046]MDN3572405.1 hypothetical protein [Methylobacterium longum]GJE09454.1 hypothetical protein FOHLNKBM_0478 [Methylobacterium longum]